jgi:4-hydroxy-tetrahydrodipicolinate synthase
MAIAFEGTFEGIFVALATPMTAGQEVDYDNLRSMVNYMIDQGVHGIIPLGSTGEYYALSPSERQDVSAAVIDAAAGRVPVVVGTNAGATRDVISYALQAQQLGAAGVLLAAPYYSLPTPDELVEHIRAVDRAIGVPIMLYNYPARTGVDMTPDVVERLAEMDNVRYIKESTGDKSRMGEIVRRCGKRISLFCGCDTLAVEFFEAGAVGWVSGAANVIPAPHVEMYELAVKRKDAKGARECYARMKATLELLEGGGKYTQWVKAGCGIMGHPVGPPRQPLLPASKAEIATLRKALRSCAPAATNGA